MNTNSLRKRNSSHIEDQDDKTITNDKRIKIKTVKELLYDLYGYLYKNYDYNIMCDIVHHTNNLQEYYIDNKNINYVKEILINRMNQSRFKYTLNIRKIVNELF